MYRCCKDKDGVAGQCTDDTAGMADTGVDGGSGTADKLVVLMPASGSETAPVPESGLAEN